MRERNRTSLINHFFTKRLQMNDPILSCSQCTVTRESKRDFTVERFKSYSDFQNNVHFLYKCLDAKIIIKALIFSNTNESS
jgi:hypothetical protein